MFHIKTDKVTVKLNDLEIPADGIDVSAPFSLTAVVNLSVEPISETPPVEEPPVEEPPVQEPPVGDHTTMVQSALDSALLGSQIGFARLPAGELHVYRPIKIEINANTAGFMGIIGNGTKLISHITDGSPVLQIEVTGPADVRYLVLEKFAIFGSGQDGSGLVLRCDHNDQWLYNWTIRDVAVEGCGEDGIQFIGSLFESNTQNVFASNNNRYGMAFFPGTPDAARGTGVVSAIRVQNGAIRKNGKSGLYVQSPARGVSVHGVDFIENHEYGILAENGIELIENCTFENNWMAAGSWQPDQHRAGVKVINYGVLRGCRFATGIYQTHGVDAWLVGSLRIDGCGVEAYNGYESEVRFMYLDGTGNATAIVYGDPGTIENSGRVHLIQNS